MAKELEALVDYKELKPKDKRDIEEYYMFLEQMGYPKELIDIEVKDTIGLFLGSYIVEEERRG